MVSGEIFGEYYLAQYRLLHICLLQENAFANPEIVHEFRLAIKRIKALNYVFNELGIRLFEHNQRIIQDVKLVFALAGNIRDIQVQNSMLHTYQDQTGLSYPEFARWLKKQELTCIAALKKTVEKQELKIPEPEADKCNTKKLWNITDDQFELIIKRLQTELLNQAEKLAYGRTSCDDFHAFRKQTKRLRYTIKPLSDSLFAGNTQVPAIETLRETETITGNWHDNLVRVEMLNSFLLTKKFKNKVTYFKYKKLQASFETAHEISFKNGLQQVRYLLTGG